MCSQRGVTTVQRRFGTSCFFSLPATTGLETGTRVALGGSGFKRPLPLLPLASQPNAQLIELPDPHHHLFERASILVATTFPSIVQAIKRGLFYYFYYYYFTNYFLLELKFNGSFTIHLNVLRISCDFVMFCIK
ncbi:hypothetical protein Q8A73_012472 [Channa argus]|nr:hypothetical protein Q8A73_012472 [Channa argus]